MAPDAALSYDDLLNALALPDDIGEWEFKACAWQLPKSVWATVSAFANTSGGGIGLGVAEGAMGSYEIVGTSDVKKVANDFTSRVDQIFNVPMGDHVEVDAHEHNGKWVMLIRVRAVPDGLKPVFDKAKGSIAGGFKRVGGSDLHLTDDDVARMYQARDRRSPDAYPVETVSLSELRAESLEVYRELLRQRAPDSRTLAYDGEALLRSLIAVAEAPDGRLVPTVAGVLLFAEDDVVQREFPAFWVDIIDIEGTEWVPDYADRFESYPSYRGSLLTIHTDVLQRLRQDLPAAFALDPGTLNRRDDLPLLVAVREALRNALIHQDYRARRPMQIRRYDDRLEIENPGYSLKPIERLGEPGSQLRNPLVARVFGDMGWSEQKGSGIRAMQEAMRAAGLTPPVFDSDPVENTFQVTFYRHHFMSEEDLAWLQEHTEGHDLSDAQKNALVMALRSGRIENPTYCQINHTDTLTASRDLRQLRDLGFLVQSQPKGPGTYYALADGLPGSQPTLALDIPVEADKEGAELTKQPTKQPIKESVKESVKEPIKRRPEAIEEAILGLCSEPRSSREIADALDMNRTYLLNRYLKQMIQEGKLQYTIPGSPRAAAQKYVVPTPKVSNG